MSAILRDAVSDRKRRPRESGSKLGPVRWAGSTGEIRKVLHSRDPDCNCSPHGAGVAQLVRAPDCGSGGPPFKPGRWYHIPSNGISLPTWFDRHSGAASVSHARQAITGRTSASHLILPAPPATAFPDRGSASGGRCRNTITRPRIHVMAPAPPDRARDATPKTIPTGLVATVHLSETWEYVYGAGTEKVSYEGLGLLGTGVIE